MSSGTCFPKLCPRRDRFEEDKAGLLAMGKKRKRRRLGITDEPLSPEEAKIADMDPGERMRLDVLVLRMFWSGKEPPKDYIAAINEEYRMRAEAEEKLGTAEKKIARGLMKYGVKVPNGML